MMLTVAVLAWPLDCMHYSVIAEQIVAGGHYYLPGSVRQFGIEDIPSVERRCFSSSDGDVTRFIISLPNDATVGLLSRWWVDDDDQRKLRVTVGQRLVAEVPVITGRVDTEECWPILLERFEDDAVLFAPLFGVTPK